jgi:lambda repressor-like predicted transcriptional regulator
MSAETLPHRQEAFARHVAAGHSLAAAARRAGYASDSARQAGSRLMKEPRVAARVADLVAEEDTRRRDEMDELVSVLKRVMREALDKKHHNVVLRAIDQIARFRNLLPQRGKPQKPATIPAFSDDAPNEADDAAADIDSFDLEAPKNILFQPPMPLGTRKPVAAMIDPRIEERRIHSAAVSRNRECVRLLLGQHPTLFAQLRDPADATLFFDADFNLLPEPQWPPRRPTATQRPMQV